MATTPTLPPPLYPADDAIRASEVFPFRSGKISIRRSRALIPLLLTAIVCVSLFGALNAVESASDMMTYMVILAFYLVAMIFVGIYLYSNERRNILSYLWPPALAALQLVFVFSYYAYVFRTLLPGNTDSKGFAAAFVGNFFGAGLCEELLKAGAGLLGLAVALILRSSGRRGIAPVRWFALQGPLDGLLMGAAAGAGFILLETMLQYVPDIIKQLHGEALGYLAGIGLMIPRVLNGVIGHMAWAGIFGYFIGLAVTHRRSAIQLVLGGWFIAAALHGLWNASSEIPGGSWISAALSLTIFLACLLKAKQLEVSRLGGVPDGHSILAVSPASPAPAGFPPPFAAYPQAAAYPAAAAVYPQAGAAYVPAPAGASDGSAPRAAAGLAAVPPSGLSIGAGALRYALAPDAVIDFSHLFPGAGAPPGTSGQVFGTPDGGLDIRNTGTTTWALTSSDGATAFVATGAMLRAAPGLRISFGQVAVDIQAY